jgi:aldehyde:ferredoxin oxidoreductase
MAVGLAVSSRGADHNRSGAYEEDFRTGSDRFDADEGKGRAAVATEDRAALLDSLILCKFLRHVFSDLETEAAAMLSAVSGWSVDAAEMARTGERIVTLKKLYNVREGWSRPEDTLPERFLSEPLRADGEASASAGARLSRADLDRMIRSYYRARGWTDEGGVPRERAVELGLADVPGIDLPESTDPSPASPSRGMA